MQFNENSEELGDISMKVLTETAFGHLFKRGNPEEEARAKFRSDMLAEWEVAKTKLESIKDRIWNMKGTEFADKIDGAVRIIDEIVSDAAIQNTPGENPTNAAPGPDSAPANGQDATA